MFLALIGYVCLLPLFHYVLLPFLPMGKGGASLLWYILLFVFSGVLGLLFTLLIDFYSPSSKRWMRDLVRVIGVRWFCALTAGVAAGFIFVQLLWFREWPGSLALGFLLPTMLVSGLNALGFEVPLRRLAEEPEPGKVVLPEVSLPPETKEEIVRSFRWNYDLKDGSGEKEYSLEFVIRRSEFERFKERTRILDLRQWADEYVKGGVNGEVRELAVRLIKLGMPFGTFREVGFVLAFVQSAVRYEKDEGEYPRYPLETLAEGIGDCEDSSILGGAILKAMGYEVALLQVPGHIALGVAGAEGLEGVSVEHAGFRYYYCEMTGKGWKFGEVPEDYKTTAIEVYPVPTLSAKVVLPERGPVPV